MIYKLKTHLMTHSQVRKPKCGQIAKRTMHLTNVSKMETCKKCRKIRAKRLK